MNAIYVSGLTIFAAATPLLMPTHAAADGTCTPHVIESKTKFPLRSQMRGQRGIVYIKVVVDETGRAQSTQLHRSSGHRLLDQAATRSVAGNWVFDVTGCERKDLPADHLVAVDYRNDAY